MLEAFVLANRAAIIARAQARVAARTSPKPSAEEPLHGVPVFLDQLGDALRLATSSDVIDHDQLRQSGSRYGRDLLRMGLTIAQVVQGYGDVCQAITELAVEQRAEISAHEYRTLNLCLDDATAAAVTEHARQRERVIFAEGTERLGVFSHELRNLLNTAMLTFGIIQTGKVSPTGSMGAMHRRNLLGLLDLVNRSLTEVRLDADVGIHERISVAEFIEETEVGAQLHAQERRLHFTTKPVDPAVAIEGDRHLLAGALTNLLQNAFKFTPHGGHVSLTTRVTEDRVLFDVEDECGGLPPGKAEDLFQAFEQRGSDRTGLGLGLAICTRAAEANGGAVHVRDLPGKGCVFTLDLPRKLPLPPVESEPPTGSTSAGEGP